MELSGNNNYQQTEAGLIPRDWAFVRLLDVAEVRGGIAKNANVAVSDPIQVAYLRVANVQDGYLDLTDISTTKINKSDLKRYSLKFGDVLMNEGGDLDKLGRGAIWREQVTPCVHQNHVFAVRCGRQLHSDYLNCWTESASARRFFLLAGKQTTNLASISKSSLGEMPLGLPCPEEQRAIASALSDIDALIAGLAKLIAKKRDLKQAAMQQLLTGQTRLPGFSGEWGSRSLGELCSLKSGSPITSDDMNDHGAYRCFGGNGLRGYSSTFTHDGSYALIGRQGALCGNVVGVQGKFFASEHALVVTPRTGVAIEWLTFVLGRMNLNQYSESSAQPGLSALKLLILEVFAPPSESEQGAIATAIASFDAELSALESRLTKTRDLKQGMMQELLTGRTRLI